MRFLEQVAFELEANTAFEHIEKMVQWGAGVGAWSVPRKKRNKDLSVRS